MQLHVRTTVLLAAFAALGLPSLTRAEAPAPSLLTIRLISPDPDELTLRQARALAQADRVFHAADVPAAILDRARADAPRIVSAALPVKPGPGVTVFVEMA